MTILLTNDDGIDSPALEMLKERLIGEHSVWIVAPDGDRSGKSHSLTLKDAIRVSSRGEKTLASSGTPSDCVAISMLGAIDEKIDMVLSGINMGPNLGTDIIYSGTAAAARQAALHGTCGVAISMVQHKGPYDFTEAADFIAANINKFKELWHDDHFININIPEKLNPDYEVEITHPSVRIYTDELLSYKAPRGELFYFLSGVGITSSDKSGEDSYAVNKGNISLSPVFLHPLNNSEHELYRSATFCRGKK